MMHAIPQSGNAQHLWMLLAGLGVALAAIVGIMKYIPRNLMKRAREGGWLYRGEDAPRTVDSSAFMTASMQGAPS